MSQTSLEKVRQSLAPQQAPAIAMNMDIVAGFENMQRAAKLFSSSTIVPLQYRGEQNLSNCFIAIDMARRMGANPLLVMQNLYVVNGNPAWSAQFLIATFNKSGRFSSLRYKFEGKPGEDGWGCRAVATELATGEELEGPLITIGMAKKSGWYSKKDKNGVETSKWQSMPEQMLRYRAASWFVRSYAPEIAMGLKTADEVRDGIIDMEADENGIFEMTLADAEKRMPEMESKKPESPSETKKHTDRERARKAVANAEATQTENQKQAKEPILAPGDILCPRENSDGSPRIVEADDCENCPDRGSCPSHEV